MRSATTFRKSSQNHLPGCTIGSVHLHIALVGHSLFLSQTQNDSKPANVPASPRNHQAKLHKLAPNDEPQVNQQIQRRIQRETFAIQQKHLGREGLTVEQTWKSQLAAHSSDSFSPWWTAMRFAATAPASHGKTALIQVRTQSVRFWLSVSCYDTTLAAIYTQYPCKHIWACLCENMGGFLATNRHIVVSSFFLSMWKTCYLQLRSHGHTSTLSHSTWQASPSSSSKLPWGLGLNLIWQTKNVLNLRLSCFQTPSTQAESHFQPVGAWSLRRWEGPVAAAGGRISWQKWPKPVIPNSVSFFPTKKNSN